MVLKPQPKPADRRDFAEYERLVRVWLQRFGLTDWQVMFDLEPVESGQDMRSASVRMAVEIRKAMFILRYGGGGKRQSSIERLAVHEVIHLAVADLLDVAGRRGEEHPDAVREEHKLIERLIPVLLPEEGR